MRHKIADVLTVVVFVVVIVVRAVEEIRERWYA